MEVCSREEFLADVASHRMKIIRNDGLYRHLEFSKSAGHRWHHWFEIVTWPNGLIIRGDMKTWVFSRIEDMFDFFRGERINPGYWQEKLQCARDDAKEFSMDALKQQAIAHLENYGEDELPPALREEVIGELEGDIFSQYGDSEEHEALRALFEFNEVTYLHKKADRKHPVTFDPCDGPFGKTWSYHYIWCCHAIQWAISQYDKGRLEESAA